MSAFDSIDSDLGLRDGEKCPSLLLEIGKGRLWLEQNSVIISGSHSGTLTPASGDQIS